MYITCIMTSSNTKNRKRLIRPKLHTFRLKPIKLQNFVYAHFNESGAILLSTHSLSLFPFFCLLDPIMRSVSTQTHVITAKEKPCMYVKMNEMNSYNSKNTYIDEDTHVGEIITIIVLIILPMINKMKHFWLLMQAFIFLQRDQTNTRAMPVFLNNLT